MIRRIIAYEKIKVPWWVKCTCEDRYGFGPFPFDDCLIHTPDVICQICLERVSTFDNNILFGHFRGHNIAVLEFTKQRYIR